MRTVLGLLHRWFGLFIAVFLFIAGLSGAIIAWDHELDAWLAPEFYHSSDTNNPRAEQLTPLVLAAQLEAKHPELRVTFMPLTLKEGDAMSAMVVARQQPSADQVTAGLPYSQVALNAYSGDIQAKRLWGEISLAPDKLLPFIYKLHYSLHLPDVSGLETGLLLMGIIGIVWVLDCLIALSISFPSRAQWRKSFAFRWGSNRQKVTFDLHRSGGVWVWLLLLMMAVTSVSMNLSSQVVRPLVGVFSALTPTPFELKAPVTEAEPALSREAIVALAQQQADKESIQVPLGGIYYASFKDIYGVGFFAPGMGHGDMGLGNPWLYFDGATGAYLGGTFPGQGSAGDIFMQAQFPLHSGRIIGLTGRILVTLLGLVIAMLSVTGIIIWARKRKSRQLARASKASAADNLAASSY